MNSTATEIEESIAVKRIEQKVDHLRDDIFKIQGDMKVQSVESSKVHVQYSEQFRRIEDNLNERFRLVGQEISHLKGITFPEYFEMKYNDMAEKVSKVEAEMREEVAFWKKFREEHYFEIVTQEEVVQFMNISGTTLKELVDVIGMEMSGISRMLNGERKKDNYVAFHKIKQYCLDKMAKKK